MKTAYQILVRIEIEGEEPPSIEDVQREVADLLRDPDDHNLHVTVLSGSQEPSSYAKRNTHIDPSDKLYGVKPRL